MARNGTGAIPFQLLGRGRREHRRCPPSLDSPEMVPSAYLRVFQPLDAFEGEEQLRWERYLVSNRWMPGSPRRYRDHAKGGLGLIAPADGDHAEVRVVDGRTYVSPWRMRMRVLAAGLAFRETRPIELSERFLSKKDAKRVARELETPPSARPARGGVLSPEPVARADPLVRALRGRGAKAGGRRARAAAAPWYRTTARKALRRAGQTIPLLRRSDLGPIGDLLMDLHEWIALFDARSLVELDYGGLCDFLTWDELDDDRSVRDLGLALEALARHEFPRSAEIYQGVLSHWAEIRGHELLN